MPRIDPALPARVALRASLATLKGALGGAQRFLSLAPSLLKDALSKAEGLPEGQVWAKDTKPFYAAWEPIRDKLADIAYDLEGIALSLPELQRKPVDDLVWLIKDMTDETSGTPRYNPNQKERPNYAFGKPLFHPGGGWAYDTDQWADWSKAFEEWSGRVSKSMNSPGPNPLI